MYMYRLYKTCNKGIYREIYYTLQHFFAFIHLLHENNLCYINDNF